MSDTPRTDREAFDGSTGEPDFYGVVMADFARQLERENAALRAALDCIAGNCGDRSPVTLTEAQEEARDALAFSKETQL